MLNISAERPIFGCTCMEAGIVSLPAARWEAYASVTENALVEAARAGCWATIVEYRYSTPPSRMVSHALHGERPVLLHNNHLPFSGGDGGEPQGGRGGGARAMFRRIERLW